MPQSLNEQLSREQQIAALEKDWATNPRCLSLIHISEPTRRS